MQLRTAFLPRAFIHIFQKQCGFQDLARGIFLNQIEKRMSEWMTAKKLCAYLGLKRPAHEGTTKIYERVGKPYAYKYRLIGKTTEFKPHCAGCETALTPNRTVRLEGQSLCMTCSRDVTVGNDKDLILKVFGKNYTKEF